MRLFDSLILTEEERELAKINLNDLRRRYDQWNRTVFDGELPRSGDIKFFWARKNAKNFAMRTGYRRNSPNDIHLSLAVNPSTAFHPEDIDAILLHEMIHVKLFVDGNLKENHGPLFRSLAKHYSKKAGVNIPVKHLKAYTDQHQAVKNARKPRKRVGIIGISFPDGSIAAMLIQPKVFQDTVQLDYIKRFLDGQLMLNKTLEPFVGYITTRAVHYLPVRRFFMGKTDLRKGRIDGLRRIKKDDDLYKLMNIESMEPMTYEDVQQKQTEKLKGELKGSIDQTIEDLNLK